MNTTEFEILLDKMASLKGLTRSFLPSRFERSLPTHKVIVGKGKRILLSGVVHGDEPAGAYILTEFLEKHAPEYENEFEFTVFPCINPAGLLNYAKGKEAFPGFDDKAYAAITRGNGRQKHTPDGYVPVNLNREFTKENMLYQRIATYEAHSVIKQINGQYLATIDFHETWSNATRVGDQDVPQEAQDPDAFLVYELCHNKDMRLGRQIIENIKKQGIKVCGFSEVYGDICQDGLISYPEANKQAAYATGSGTFDSYLWENHTDQAFTIETARNDTLENRINAGILSIKTVLDARR